MPYRRLHTITVRMPASWHQLFAQAAADNGVSVAAYFREAAFIRWAFDRAAQLESELGGMEELQDAREEIAALSERLHRLYGLPRAPGREDE